MQGVEAYREAFPQEIADEIDSQTDSLVEEYVDQFSPKDGMGVINDTVRDTLLECDDVDHQLKEMWVMLDVQADARDLPQLIVGHLREMQLHAGRTRLRVKMFAAKLEDWQEDMQEEMSVE